MTTVAMTTVAMTTVTTYSQVLLQMPVVHRRSFVFIITFLKQLLDHSQENQMDAKLLGE